MSLPSNARTNFLFYETCTPMILTGYAFFWPIVAATCVGLAFLSFRSVVGSWACILVGGFGFLYARAARRTIS